MLRTAFNIETKVFRQQKLVVHSSLNAKVSDVSAMETEDACKEGEKRKNGSSFEFWPSTDFSRPI